MLKASQARSGLQTLPMPVLFALAISSVTSIGNAQQPEQNQRGTSPIVMGWLDRCRSRRVVSPG
jgi:hypothetical protein